MSIAVMSVSEFDLFSFLTPRARCVDHANGPGFSKRRAEKCSVVRHDGSRRVGGIRVALPSYGLVRSPAHGLRMPHFMLQNQARSPVPEFRCHSAADRIKFRCRRLGQITSKDLILNIFCRLAGEFLGAETGFSPAVRGIRDGCYAGSATACVSAAGCTSRKWQATW
jgi:hypothetical protein